MADDHLKGSKAEQKQLEMDIAQTQESLGRKAQALVSELRHEVKDTLHRVADSVETSVATVSGSLEENIRQVSEMVQGTVGDVRTALDLPARVQSSPLKMFGFAAAAGAVAGLMMGGGRRTKTSVGGGSRTPVDPGAVGPAALMGLGISLLRPVLLAAAKELVVHRLHSSISAGSRDTAYNNGGGTGARGPVYHNY